MDDIVKKLIRKHKTNDPFSLARCLNINIRFTDLGKNTREYIIKLYKEDSSSYIMICRPNGKGSYVPMSLAMTGFIEELTDSLSKSIRSSILESLNAKPMNLPSAY